MKKDNMGPKKNNQNSQVETRTTGRMGTRANEARRAERRSHSSSPERGPEDGISIGTRPIRRTVSVPPEARDGLPVMSQPDRNMQDSMSEFALMVVNSKVAAAKIKLNSFDSKYKSLENQEDSLEEEYEALRKEIQAIVQQVISQELCKMNVERTWIF